jgi:hypothetical protein
VKHKKQDLVGQDKEELLNAKRVILNHLRRIYFFEAGEDDICEAEV